MENAIGVRLIRRPFDLYLLLKDFKVTIKQTKNAWSKIELISQRRQMLFRCIYMDAATSFKKSAYPIRYTRRLTNKRHFLDIEDITITCC